MQVEIWIYILNLIFVSQFQALLHKKKTHYTIKLFFIPIQIIYWNNGCRITNLWIISLMSKTNNFGTNFPQKRNILLKTRFSKLFVNKAAQINMFKNQIIVINYGRRISNDNLNQKIFPVANVLLSCKITLHLYHRVDRQSSANKCDYYRSSRYNTILLGTS